MGMMKEKFLILGVVRAFLESASSAARLLVMTQLLLSRMKMLMQSILNREIQQMKKDASTVVTRINVLAQDLSPTTEFPRDNSGMMKEKFLILGVVRAFLESASSAARLLVMTQLLLSRMKMLMQSIPNREIQQMKKDASTVVTRINVLAQDLSPTTEFPRDNSGMMREKFLILGV